MRLGKPHDEREVRTYYRGLGPVWSRSEAPGQGLASEAHLKLKHFYVFQAKL